MEDWRRIDIDALEHDTHLTKADLIPDLPETPYEQVASNAQEIRLALSLGKFGPALELALSSPPYVALEQTKNLALETVFEVLVSIKNNHNTNDFSGFVKQLSSDQQDVLVKYIYKIMETPFGAKQGALMLSWFEKTVEVTGMGSVVRYFADRRTV